MIPDPEQEREDREETERVKREVEAVWLKTADALRRLALLEIETALLMTREKG